jgi:hypothetical protein
MLMWSTVEGIQKVCLGGTLSSTQVPRSKIVVVLIFESRLMFVGFLDLGVSDEGREDTMWITDI